VAKYQINLKNAIAFEKFPSIFFGSIEQHPAGEPPNIAKIAPKSYFGEKAYITDCKSQNGRIN